MDELRVLRAIYLLGAGIEFRQASILDDFDTLSLTLIIL